MLTLTDQDFQRLYVYIKQNYGIDLSKKKQLIVSRLSHTLAAQGFRDFKGYVDEILSGRDTDMVTAMLNKLTTNYTYFLREEAHFKYFQEIILPDLEKKHAADKSLSIWSAGCSSGQEPYTISMFLLEYFGSKSSQWDTRILATDISNKILDEAIRASYPEESMEPLPATWKTKYFVKTGNGKCTVSPALKKNVIFRPFNLMDPITFKKKFDLIFCRNVMIYFDQDTKDALVRRFYNATVPGGHLFIGHSEGLTKSTCPYEYIQPAIYKKNSQIGFIQSFKQERRYPFMVQKIRVMVVDDSMLFRSWLIKCLQEDPRFEVVGFAANALEAKSKLPMLKPDIMTLDIEMPGMTGLQFLKEVLPVHPVPIILVSSLNVQVFDALAAGAVDFVRKPESEPGARERFIRTLRSKLAVGKNAHPRLPSHDPSAILNKAKAASVGSAISSSGGIGLQHTLSAAHRTAAAPAHSNVDVIAIGASTGGTEAILEVVRHFPAKMPGIVITQHMPAGFTSMYAERLNRICNLQVREAKHGDKIQPGLVLLAPGGLQMRVVRMGSGYAVTCSDGEKVSGHKPSVDVLFDSVASTVRNRAIGVILTGMGADGAAGMLRMRKAGAYTIGQDRDSCVVYGMPMEAFKIGAVCMQAPLNSIHHAVMGRLAKG